jgi:hypothetical protein
MTDIITLIIAILGALGWIPTIWKYLRPKPQLRINKVNFLKIGYGPIDKLEVEIENKCSSVMATNLSCLFVVYKDDGTKVDDNSNRLKTIGYLAPKTKTTVALDCSRIEHYHVKIVNVYIKVQCDEGTTKSRTFKNIELSFPPLIGQGQL